MTAEQMPGDSPEDRELRDRWHRQSAELPGDALDDSLRAAARRDLDGAQESRTGAGHAQGRLTTRWLRYAPLAAAASVALLAVGLVRQMPREDVLPRTAVPEPAVTSETIERARDAPSPVSPQLKASAESEMHGDNLPFVANEPALEPATPPPAPPVREESIERYDLVEQDASAAADTALARSNAAPAPPESKLAKVSAEGLQSGASTVTSTQIQAGPVDLPAELASLLRADAAERSAVDIERVRVVSASSITWPDGSLGCGKPGEIATQALVPGYVVEIDVAGTRLRYHTDRERRFRPCADD